MKTHRLIVLVLTVLLSSNFAHSQDSKISLIGEDESAYEAIIADCPTLLLNVAENSMDKAYAVWSDMLSEIEDKAEQQGLDLKGTKLWVNLFWEADGSIKKIVYYPKPNSKNMDYSSITKFLEDFSVEYQFPLTSDGCFSHYGSASFPIHSRALAKNAK